MNFLIEKLYLPDRTGGAAWSETPAPHPLCEATGADAGAVLALVVAAEGGVQVGMSAAFTNGEAVMVAQKGESLYAVRAIPHGTARLFLARQDAPLSAQRDPRG